MPVGFLSRLLVVVLVPVVRGDPFVPPRVLRNEEKHGATEKAGFSELDFEGVKDCGERLQVDSLCVQSPWQRVRVRMVGVRVRVVQRWEVMHVLMS